MSHPPSLAQTEPLSILHHGRKKCQGETEEEDCMVDYCDVVLMPFQRYNSWPRVHDLTGESSRNLVYRLNIMSVLMIQLVKERIVKS